MNLDKVRAFSIPAATQAYTRRDSILYALSLGCGDDAADPSQWPYLVEAGQRVLPSQCVALAYPRAWQQDAALGIAWARHVNGELGFRIHKPLPPAGRVRSEMRIFAVADKGQDKGATLYTERVLTDVEGDPLATISQTVFLPGDGGHGGFGTPPDAAALAPDRTPDHVVEFSVAGNAVLLYRLGAAYNPAQATAGSAPETGARETTVPGPCTLGMACRAAIGALCEGKPDRLKAMSARFLSPVHPGDRLRFEFHGSGPRVQWRARVPARGVTVLDRGRLECLESSVEPGSGKS